jgi:molecular chaperone GrpE
LSPRKKKELKEENDDMKKQKSERESADIEQDISETAATEPTSETAAEETVTEAEIESPETALIKLQTAYDELNDKFLRLNAEFQNYRKRVEKEKGDIFKFGNEKLLIEMLPIMDNFERALSATDANQAEDKVLSGVKLIKKSLDEFFEKNGVKKIEAMHEPFDPDKHHAVMSEDSDDYEIETVIEVYQEGYALNEKVIRPSMVKVTK